MSFFNPLPFLFFLTIHSLNLLHMGPEIAKDLSGTYNLVKNTESTLQVGQCPDAFNIELISGASPDQFIFKNQVKFKGLQTSLPRVLPIDGQIRTFAGGQVVKGEVTKPNAFEVAFFNPKDPKEAIVETFEFTNDGNLLYSTDHKAPKQRKVAFFNALCSGMRYQKM